MMSTVPMDFVSGNSDLEVTVDKSLKLHFHISKNLVMSYNITTNLIVCKFNRNSEFLTNICTLHLKPLFEYVSSLWNIGYLRDAKLLLFVRENGTLCPVHVNPLFSAAGNHIGWAEAFASFLFSRLITCC